MPYCFAFGCNSGSRTKVAVPVRFFRPPKDLTIFNLWKQKIPRKDKELTASASVCEKHFLEEDIVKTNKIVKKGKEIIIERKNWKLREGAIPVVFEGCPKYLSSIPLKRSEPKTREAVVPKTVRSYKRKEPCKEVSATSKAVQHVVVVHDIDKVSLPNSTWKVGFPTTGHTNGTHRYYYQLLDGNPLICQKMASVDFVEKTIKFTVLSNEVSVVSEEYKTFGTIPDLENILLELDNFDISPGVTNNKFSPNALGIKIFSGYFQDGVWRSNKCSLLLLPDVEAMECSHCKALKNTLTKRLSRNKKVGSSKYVNHKYITMKQFTKIVVSGRRKQKQQAKLIKKKTEQLAGLQAEVKKLRTQFAEVKNDAINQMLSQISDEKVCGFPIF